MASLEKTVLILMLFSGFLWLRRRARALSLEGQIQRATLGVFVLLPALLIGEKFLFEQLPFGFWTNLLVKIAGVAATFPLIGYVFLKNPPSGDGLQAPPTAAGDVPAADTPASAA